MENIKTMVKNLENSEEILIRIVDIARNLEGESQRELVAVAVMFTTFRGDVANFLTSQVKKELENV